MSKIFRIAIPIIFIISLLFGGVSSLGIADTLHGVRQTLLENPGTSIYMSDQLYVFFFPKGENYAFTGISKGNGMYQMVKTICNANCTDFKTAAEFLNWIEKPASGFSKITPKDLPPDLVGLLMSFRIYLVSIGAGTFPTLFAFPMVILENSIIQPTGVIQ